MASEGIHCSLTIRFIENVTSELNEPRSPAEKPEIETAEVSVTAYESAHTCSYIAVTSHSILITYKRSYILLGQMKLNAGNMFGGVWVGAWKRSHCSLPHLLSCF